MADRIKLVAYNEGTRGSRKMLQSYLETRGFRVDNLDVFYPGCDAVWYTRSDPPKIVGVQIKTIIDFMTSWWNGRLQRQLEQMHYSAHIRVLLIEGLPRYDPDTGGIDSIYGLVTDMKNRPIPYHAYMHCMADLTGNMPPDKRIALVQTPNLKYTVDWLDIYGPKYYDENHTGWDRIETPPSDPDKALQVLLSWVNISQGRAKLLLEKYGTPYAALDAIRREEDLGIRGIGDTILNSIRKQWSTQYVERDNGN